MVTVSKSQGLQSKPPPGQCRIPTHGDRQGEGSLIADIIVAAIRKTATAIAI
jgi:hypothetical protein